MIVIIDSGMGNVRSIYNMLRKVGVTSKISNDVEVISQSEKLILPGVGSFDAGMESLYSLGLVGVLNQRVLVDKVPILGICLGMQLFSNSSEEGRKKGLGWIDTVVKRFDFSGLDESYKVPHMGWNHVRPSYEHALFKNIPEPIKYYFVHSFHYVSKNNETGLACAHHGYDFICAIAQDNILGVQFHPEKSHKFGMQMLLNFAEL